MPDQVWLTKDEHWNEHDTKVRTDPGEYALRIYFINLDFDLVDKRGRHMGCALTVEDAAPHVERINSFSNATHTVPRTISSRVQATRDGHKFGAIAATMAHRTVEDAKRSVWQRGLASRARSLKNAHR